MTGIRHVKMGLDGVDNSRIDAIIGDLLDGWSIGLGITIGEEALEEFLQLVVSLANTA